MVSSKLIDVLVLAGGKGTRLSSVVSDRPKPMADINGRPFLDKLITHVLSCGLTRIILCAGYKAEKLIEHYESKFDIGAEVVLSVEKFPLGTAGAVKNAERLIQSDIICVMNGDSYCPVDLIDFIDFHRRKNSQVSIAVVETKNTNDYGVIEFDNLQQVLSFEEKKSNSSHCYINAGVYILNKSILSKIPESNCYSFEQQFFPSIIGKDFYAYVVDGILLDIGTPQRYLIAKEYFSD